MHSCLHGEIINVYCCVHFLWPYVSVVVFFPPLAAAGDDG